MFNLLRTNVLLNILNKISKKILYIAFVVMTIALIGIVVIQFHWVKEVIKEKEEQFDLNVKQIVSNVADDIQQREINEFVDDMIESAQMVSVPSMRGLSKLFIVHLDTLTRHETLYSQSLIEEGLGFTRDFADFGRDTLDLKKITSRRLRGTISDVLSLEKGKKNITAMFSKNVGHINEINRSLFYSSYKDVANIRPLDKRVSKEELDMNLQLELISRDIVTDFDYAVYKEDSITSVHSANFSTEVKEGSNVYSALLFPDNDGYSDYELVLVFTKKDSLILSSMSVMVTLSVLFTLLIIFAYSYTLHQSLYQRRSSQMKTDFINNMTHEFKTPIATISLALDALKNDKIGGDTEKRSRYINAINEENLRMHTQVENILRISQFGRENKNLKFKTVPLDNIVWEAVGHVSLIVETKGGIINCDFNAENVLVKVADGYLLSALINILDNAIKYSEAELLIDVSTFVEGDDVLIKIKDRGIGISKSTQKRIFERFYREQSGNIHNVKGHGLGLAFVMYSIRNHGGTVWVDSELGKGSTFYIKLPKS